MSCCGGGPPGFCGQTKTKCPQPYQQNPRPLANPCGNLSPCCIAPRMVLCDPCQGRMKPCPRRCPTLPCFPKVCCPVPCSPDPCMKPNRTCPPVPCCNPAMIIRPVLSNCCQPPTPSNQGCSIPCCSPLPPCCVMIKPSKAKKKLTYCCPSPPSLCGTACPRPDPLCSPKPMVVSFKCPTSQYPLGNAPQECSEIKCPVIRLDENDCGSKGSNKAPEMCMMSMRVQPMSSCGGGCN